MRSFLRARRNRHGILTRYARLVLSLSLAVSSYGCADGEKANSAESAVVSGIALAHHPVKGADVAVVDSSGTTVSVPASTRHDGKFDVPISGGKAPYTIVVTGGTRDGKPLKGVLKSDVDKVVASSTVLVSPISSLTSAYRDRHTDAAVVDADTKVKQFLDVPESTNTTSWLASTDPHFDAAAYMIAADAAGGVDQHEGKLLDTMDASPTAKVRFGSALGSATEEGSPNLWVEAVKGAASGASGPLYGWVAKKEGIPSEASRLDEIGKKLEAISKQVANLSHTVSEIDQKAAYAPLAPIRDQVLSTQGALQDAADGLSNDATRKALKDDLEQSYMKAVTDRNQPLLVSGYLTGSSISGSGLFAAYRSEIADPYWCQSTTDRFTNQFSYWQWIQAEQYTQAVEYLHLNDGRPNTSSTEDSVTTAIAQALGQRYLDALAEQKRVCPPPSKSLATWIAYSPKLNLMIAYASVARWDDSDWSVKRNGIPRTSQYNNPGWVVSAFNGIAGGPGGHSDWRLPTRDECKGIFSGSDYKSVDKSVTGRAFDGLFSAWKDESDYLDPDGIVWTSDWKDGYAAHAKDGSSFRTYRKLEKSFLDYHWETVEYNGTNEKYSPGPASILFVRTPGSNEGYVWPK